MLSESAPSRLNLILAFAAIYVIWGSTYLAILFAIETLPPFLMASARFLIAGALLYAWARLHGRAARPTREQWRAAAVVGVLLLLGGNGLVVWAQTRVPSGVAALLIGMLPCWMVLFDWLRPRGVRPGPQIVLGLALGLAGLVWLIGPDSLMGGGRVDLLGALALLVAEV
jgi:drug/metabolite transporter (DMT)-like permease